MDAKFFCLIRDIEAEDFLASAFIILVIKRCRCYILAATSYKAHQTGGFFTSLAEVQITADLLTTDMLFAPFQVLVAATDRISFAEYSNFYRIALCSISPVRTLYTANSAVKSKNAALIIGCQAREQGRFKDFAAFFRVYYSRFPFASRAMQAASLPFPL